MRHNLLFAAVVAGLLVAAPASAQHGMSGMAMSSGHGGMGHGMDAMTGGDSHFMMLLKSANLTPQQHAQVRQILQGEKAQMKSVYLAFHSLHEQIAAKLLAPGNVTAADLAPLEAKANRYHEQISRDMVNTALAIRNILTPEQIARLSQVHQQLQSLHAQIRSLLGSDAEESNDQQN
jgi:Spy/CpxP family protein refolding chaperone